MKPLKKHYRLFATITTVFFSACRLSAQFVPEISKAGWRAVILAKAAHATHGADYLNGTFILRRQTETFNFGLRLEPNPSQQFTFLPGRLIIKTADSDVTFADNENLKARPEFFGVNKPASVFGWLKKHEFEFDAGLTLITQNARFDTADVQTLRDSLYFVDWRTVKQNANQFLLSASLAQQWKNFRISAGVLALPIYQNNSSVVKRGRNFKAQGVFGLAWRADQFSASATATGSDLGLSFQKTLGRTNVHGAGTTLAMHFQRGIGGFLYNAGALHLSAPLSDRIRGLISVQHVHSPNSITTIDTFENWLASNVYTPQNSADLNLPKTAVAFGVEINLSQVTKPPIELLDFQLVQHEIFFSKRAVYAANPIALATVVNRSRHEVNFHLNAETMYDAGDFRSERLSLEPREKRAIPIYLHLNRSRNVAAPLADRLEISARMDKISIALADAPLTVYGKNAWSGKTWELKFFASPEDPIIKNEAKKAYLSALAVGSEHHDEQKLRFKRLASFLDNLGGRLNYVPDPITTIEIDNVQFPGETLMKGGGDCEDLTVCLASALGAVGYATAVVDVRPPASDNLRIPRASPASIGHVFLLIDTGISPEHAEILDLTEFQAITRTSRSGVPTIWLPIETSVINKGFEAAFSEGVKIYYQEVFENNGIEKGRIHVYDF